jgi:uncharacterized protein (TIGR02421 family)
MEQKMRIDIQDLTLDEALADCAKQVKPLYYIEPVNEKAIKAEFLAGRIKNPIFVYKPLEYNPEEIEAILTSIGNATDSEIGNILNSKKQEMLLENRVIANRGAEDIVRQATSSLYGVPSKELVCYAESILKQVPPKADEKDVPSDVIKKALEDALSENGLDDWKIEFSDKRLTTVYPAEKKITVCKDRKFASKDPARLKLHEVGVHAVRGANGYEQPLKVFAIGLPGYMTTEEGLTSFFEEVMQVSDEETLRKYAAEVIAINALCTNLDFRDTFDKLRSYNINNEDSWNISVRAHRGGGYIKDHIYLKGLVKVREFAKNYSDLKTLFVGKIGIEDLPLVKELIKKGIVKEAKHIPKFISNVCE